MHKALYREYRPLVFDDVIGQDHIIRTLKNQIKENSMSHAYLFCGTRVLVRLLRPRYCLGQ